uniref:Adenosine receptor A3-like isoform X3 n=1 Tax=Actinia tenebrosa TaxID=6105 RepID=A0A6P8ICJ7_ACTTE
MIDKMASNNTTDGDPGEYFMDEASYSLAEIVAWSFAFGLEGFLIICGNILTISTFVGTKRLRRQSTILLINLATADLCVGLLSIPVFIYYFVDYLYFFGENEALGMTHRILDAGTAYASLFSLVLVSLERVRVIVWPLQHRLTTRQFVFATIAAAWILAFILPFLDYTDTGVPVSFYIAVPMLAVSLIIMCAAYVVIWVQVRYKRQKSHRKESSDFERAFAITLLIVTATSVVAWLPFQAILIIETLCAEKCAPVSDNVLYTSKLLHYGNSLVNPVIYSLRFPEFKKAAFRILSVNRHSGSKNNDPALMPMQEIVPSPNQTANSSIRWTWKSRSLRGSTKSNGSPRLQLKEEEKRREDLQDLVEQS